MEILKSKKFQVFAASLVVLILTQLVGLEETQALQIKEGLMGLAGTYLIGQGIADHGKEAAKVEA
ncbi:hypothetical protein OAF54_03495 [bacterium]|nr:hypothetical protein [bacterium]